MIKLTWKTSKRISIEREPIIQTQNVATGKFIYWYFNAIFSKGSFSINRVEFLGVAQNAHVLSFGCIKGEHDSMTMRLVFDSVFQQIDQVVKV